MSNGFAHLELNTSDVAAARKFYTSLFDWKLNDMGAEPPYLMISNVPKGSTGGGLTFAPKGVPPAWLPYVEVADVAKSLAKAKKAGGTVMLDKTDIGQMGFIGVVIDPQGAAIGVWQKPAPKKATKKKPSKKK